MAKKVKVFSSPNCPYCVALKAFLKEKKIIFEEIDVSEDEKAAKEMVEKTGQLGVPVVEIDGEFVVGFDREKITEILKLET
ncbi:MAG: glutaredoxin domain-containing protein [Patescibacteria group bacterium]|nr:glutaredoxin domain-containing protein [Patescibacteria group bacterium]